MPNFYFPTTLLYKPEKSFKCLKKSHIQFLALALRDLPVHWLLTPTIDKQPIGFEWQKHPFTPKTLSEQLEKRETVQVKHKSGNSIDITPTGFAIICGQNSQEYLVAVDCDGESVYKEIPALPPTIAFTSGRQGRGQYLFKIPANFSNLKSKKITTKAGEKLELRGTGHASVLPPSIHPLSCSYYWLPRCSPQEIEVAVAPDWVISKMLIPPPQPKQLKNELSLSYWSKSQTGEEEKRALKFLQNISANFADDYHSWIQIGMALKSVNSNLLSAWDQWSQQSSKYKPGECESKWKSFKNTRSTIGTLYYFANQP